ncbi:MAG: response regulator transcription factor [Bacillota bacterium]|jgi:DNA-binding response OmpR family regulator|nr:response regulator transcription factor [Bacillota bacterium]HHU43460.1 response regulator transcription factor [Clostridiales bacterium]
MKLLLIEDEKNLSEALQHIFKKEKYSVDAVYDGESGLDYGLSGIYDVIILDLMLPKKSGMDVLKQLRENGITTPILILTAKGSISDKVEGLDSGADDYLAKPFSTPELLARVRALLRRKTESINEDILSYGDIELNLSSYELVCGEKSVKVSLKECEIMRYLLQRPKFVVTKDELIIKLWGYDSEAEYNNIEVYISFLRKKLQFLETKTEIVTVRGAGYKLVHNV